MGRGRVRIVEDNSIQCSKCDRNRLVLCAGSLDISLLEIVLITTFADRFTIMNKRAHLKTFRKSENAFARYCPISCIKTYLKKKAITLLSCLRIALSY